jgi:hypothetical protein
MDDASERKEEIPHGGTTSWDIHPRPRSVATGYSRRTKADHEAWLSSNIKVPTPKANDPPWKEHLWQVPIPNLCNRLGPNLSNVVAVDSRILPTSGKIDCFFATMEFLGLSSVEGSQFGHMLNKNPTIYDAKNQIAGTDDGNYHHSLHELKWNMDAYQVSKNFTWELRPNSVGEIQLNQFFDMLSPGYMTYAGLLRTKRAGHAVILGKNKDHQPILIDRQKNDKYIIGMPQIVQYFAEQSITSLSYITRRKTKGYLGRDKRRW